MKKVNTNQFIMLALLSTSLMAAVIYNVEWPESRKVASTQAPSTSSD